MHSRDGRLGAGGSPLEEPPVSVVIVADGGATGPSLAARLAEATPSLSVTVLSATDADDVAASIDSGPDRAACVVAPFQGAERSGIELFEAVRARGPVPFVLVDDDPTPERASRALAAGVEDYVPLDSEAGVATVAARCRRLADRRRANGGRSARDRHLETLLDDLPGMVYRCRDDRDWTMEFVSDGAEALTGYDSAALTGEAVSYGDDVIHPDDHEEVWTAVQEALAAREPFRMDYRIVTADDEVRWVWEQGRGVFDSGEVDGLQGFITDVTERREARRELAERNRRLDEFAAVVSHDLRNPLNVATGHLELAREERADPHLGRVRDALGRMDELIEDLLALSRQGESVDAPEPVHLGRLAEQCWATVETGGATLCVETDRTVLADRSRLRQLLENLFRNAVEHGSTSPRSQARADAIHHGSSGDAAADGSVGDHTDDGADGGADRGPTAAGLTVSLRPLDGASGFAVADDGVGIPSDAREEIFEASHSTAVGGTGFGLAIVRDVATAHGWSVRATGGETGGARFEVTGVEFVDGD